MLRMSKETDYGILLITRIAELQEQTVSARELSSETGIPLPMVSKILKVLAKDGLLTSQRGPKGGYFLSAPASQISVAKVITAIEGPFALTECIEAPGDCRQEATCSMRHNWTILNDRIRYALEEVSIADMSRPLSKELIMLEPARPS